jgi:hypothetical protein
MRSNGGHKVTHGTPHDHPTCTTDLTCNNHRTNLMTCREAAIRYNGDYAYRKQVDAGTATTEKATFPKPERVKVPKAPKLGSKPRAPRPSRAKPAAVRSITHGTISGYRNGCRDGCPAAVTCRAVKAEKERVQRRRRGIKPRVIVAHGTNQGYKKFECRSDCPSAAAGGISCSEAATIVHKAAWARRIAA